MTQLYSGHINSHVLTMYPWQHMYHKCRKFAGLNFCSFHSFKSTVKVSCQYKHLSLINNKHLWPRWRKSICAKTSLGLKLQIFSPANFPHLQYMLTMYPWQHTQSKVSLYTIISPLPVPVLYNSVYKAVRYNEEYILGPITVYIVLLSGKGDVTYLSNSLWHEMMLKL